jgi:hypothetical protein
MGDGGRDPSAGAAGAARARGLDVEDADVAAEDAQQVLLRRVHHETGRRLLVRVRPVQRLRERRAVERRDHDAVGNAAAPLAAAAGDD